MARRRFRLTTQEIYFAKKHMALRTMTQSEIARHLGCAPSTISYIKAGKLGAEVPWPVVFYDGRPVPVTELDEVQVTKIAAEKGVIGSEDRPWMAVPREKWETLKRGINRWRVENGLEATENDSELWQSHQAIWDEARVSPSTIEPREPLVYSAPTEEDWAELEREKAERGKMKGPATYIKRDLDEILRLGRGKYLMRICEGEDSSPTLREALQMMCAIHKDPQSWDDEWFIKQVQDMEIRIRNWPEGMERVKREQFIGTEIIKDAVGLTADEQDELPRRTDEAIDRDIEEEIERVGEIPARPLTTSEEIAKLIRQRQRSD